MLDGRRRDKRRGGGVRLSTKGAEERWMQNSRDGEPSWGREAGSVPPRGGSVSICVPLEIEKKTKAEGVHAEDEGALISLRVIQHGG